MCIAKIRTEKTLHLLWQPSFFIVYNKGTSLSLPVPFYRLCFIGFLPAPDSHYLYENENDYSLHII